MSVLVITADALLGMAQQSAFSWMGSLEAVRLIARTAKAGCSTCGGRQSGPSVSIDPETYRRVVTSGAFKGEVVRLKTLLGYERVEIIVDGTVTSL